MWRQAGRRFSEVLRFALGIATPAAHGPGVPPQSIRLALRAPTEWHLQTLYRWDGDWVLTILGKPSWRVESPHLEVLASLLLYHVTNDRALAEARAKAFAAEILQPLAGAPASILSGAVEAWLDCSPRAIEQERERPMIESPVVRCSGCGAPVSMHPRHVPLLEVFGTLCGECRTQVPA